MVLVPSDDALLAAMALGDVEAMTTFTRRWQPRVHGLARTILGDPAQAEDVAQEAFLKAWHHAGAFDPCRGSAGAWMLTITRNHALDVLRMRRVDPVDPEVLARIGQAVPEGDGPAWRAEVGDDVRRLHAALAELPVEQRRAVVMAAIGGRTAQEVSESEGIPLGTAKTRIRSAMLRLRARLDPARERT